MDDKNILRLVEDNDENNFILACAMVEHLDRKQLDDLVNALIEHWEIALMHNAGHTYGRYECYVAEQVFCISIRYENGRIKDVLSVNSLRYEYDDDNRIYAYVETKEAELDLKRMFKKVYEQHNV